MSYVLSHQGLDDSESDPVTALREGWDQHVRFGLENPYLYSLIYGEPEPGRTSDAAEAAAAIIAAHVHRIAEAGLLKVSEERAVDLVQAMGRGTTLALIGTPTELRTDAFSRAACDTVVAAIANTRPASSMPGGIGAAVALRATLPTITSLTEHEAHLLNDWLDRIVEGGRVSDVASRPS